jgi:hypothetical protein
MIDTIEYQSKTAQDMVRSGDDWMVVCDGHGTGTVIDHLRTLNWSNIVKDADPSSYLNDSIYELGDTTGDGSTLSMVKIKENGIDCVWLGDSQIRIYADEKEVWQSKNHNKDNPDEINTHMRRGGKISKSWSIQVLDPNTITMEPSYYFEFDKYERVAMTRALGHNKRYTPLVVRRFFPFNTHPNAKSWKVIVGSDGLWDMMCPADEPTLGSSSTGAADIGDLAQSRWHQEWNYKHPPPHKTTNPRERISSNRDDIGIAVWQKRT